jgi:hypothetical protein
MFVQCAVVYFLARITTEEPYPDGLSVRIVANYPNGVRYFDPCHFGRVGAGFAIRFNNGGNCQNPNAMVASLQILAHGTWTDALGTLTANVSVEIGPMNRMSLASEVVDVPNGASVLDKTPQVLFLERGDGSVLDAEFVALASAIEAGDLEPLRALKELRRSSHWNSIARRNTLYVANGGRQWRVPPSIWPWLAAR